MNSSPMISTIGRQTISTTPFKSLSLSGSGVVRISRSSERVFSMAMVRSGTMPFLA